VLDLGQPLDLAPGRLGLVAALGEDGPLALLGGAGLELVAAPGLLDLGCLALDLGRLGRLGLMAAPGA
jgi:hypothetical protein